MSRWLNILIRIVVGIIFFAHGFIKFSAGMDQTIASFQTMGISPFIAYLVSFIELVGGIALIIGFATRLVAFIFSIILLGAIFTAKWSAGLIGGYEFDLSLLLNCLYLLVYGAKSFAFDRLLYREEKFI